MSIKNVLDLMDFRLATAASNNAKQVNTKRRCMLGN